MRDRVIKGLILLVITTMCLASLAACGNKVSGRYDLVSFNVDGTEIPVTMVDEVYEASEMYIEFDDNQCTLFVFDISAEGTFVQNGDSLTITIEDESVSGTVDGNRVSIDFEGRILIFEKP
ncbi:MAG: hypothetical protein FWH40_03035 [Coriobacteriia bacterium]|nr:hypothetical protein [Coriobacteriia bacterium]